MVVYSKCQSEISCLLVNLRNFISEYVKERTREIEEEIQTEREHTKDRKE